ncbi:DUF4194 domain-containing protein [Vibrio rotiferianus]|uniref:DUF4194 domain-containing protein n=1 Tax=Vibrio rotiferianus TaxID=190895 RepID=A0A7Y3Z5H0_9VIBR|nr:DUF4194 domain-containing protein [Vibrio rotiferianus]NOH46470.1 DUF4194 domain-containing protein [Vibrio rotiferianus]
MLRDLKLLLNKPENDHLVDDDFYQAAAQIRHKQFIWYDGHGQRSNYNLVLKHKEYFSDLFGAFGDDFVLDNNFGFCGVIPKYHRGKMKQLDTLFLLILAKLYDTEARKACIENGKAKPSPSLLIDNYIELTGKEKPKYADTKAALYSLEKSGLISLGEKDEISELPEIVVLPTIKVVLSEQYISLLEGFAKGTDDPIVVRAEEEKITTTVEVTNE